MLETCAIAVLVYDESEHNKKIERNAKIIGLNANQTLYILINIQIRGKGRSCIL
jgi:hypothetical protein